MTVSQGHRDERQAVELKGMGAAISPCNKFSTKDKRKDGLWARSVKRVTSFLEKGAF